MRPRFQSVLRSSSLLIILLLSLTSCLEHRYIITALPNEGFNIDYQARGDLPDLEDGFDLFPDSLQWHLERTIEEQEDETTHILSGEIDIVGYGLFQSAFDWRKSRKDSIYFQPKFSIKKDRSYFGERHLFQCLLQSRDFNLKYGDVWEFAPPECRVLENNPEQSGLGSEDIEALEEKFAAASLQWNLARYKTRLYDVWIALKTAGVPLEDTSNVAFSIAMAGWNDDLRLYLNNLDIPDPKVVNLEWWDDVKSLFMGRLVDLCGIENAVLIQDVSEAMEREYQISKDIKDDTYSILVKLDGQTITSNGKKIEGGYYSWEVPGDDILNENKVLELETFDFNLWRISSTLIFILLILRMLMRRLRSTKKHNGGTNE